MSFVCLLVVT